MPRPLTQLVRLASRRHPGSNISSERRALIVIPSARPVHPAVHLPFIRPCPSLRCSSSRIASLSWPGEGVSSGVLFLDRFLCQFQV